MEHTAFGVISQTGTVQNLGIVNANLQTPSNAASTNMGILADWANQAKSNQLLYNRSCVKRS